MANKALYAALLLLGLVSVASAARQWESIKLPDIEGLLRRRGGGGEKVMEKKAIVSIRFTVPEAMHDEFIDRWQKVEDETLEEKGLLVFDLKKSVDTNTRFYSYGEWDTMEDWVDHMRSDYVKDFIDFINDEDILVDICFLKGVTDEKYEKYGRKETEETEDNIFFVVRYHVPPSAYDDFIDAWTDIAKDIWEEDGNINYSLKKYATNNHHWLVYGAFDTFDDYMEHVQSKQHERLHDFLADNGITYEKECLKKFGTMERRKKRE